MKKLLLVLIVFVCLNSTAFAGWVQKRYWVQETVPTVVSVNPSPYWCSNHGHWIYPSPYTAIEYRMQWVERCYSVWEPDVIYVQPCPVHNPPIYVLPPPICIPYIN